MFDVDYRRADLMPERIRERKRPGRDCEVHDGEHDGHQAGQCKSDSIAPLIATDSTTAGYPGAM